MVVGAALRGTVSPGLLVNASARSTCDAMTAPSPPLAFALGQPSRVTSAVSAGGCAVLTAPIAVCDALTLSALALTSALPLSSSALDSPQPHQYSRIEGSRIDGSLSLGTGVDAFGKCSSPLSSPSLIQVLVCSSVHLSMRIGGWCSSAGSSGSLPGTGGIARGCAVLGGVGVRRHRQQRE